MKKCNDEEEYSNCDLECFNYTENIDVLDKSKEFKVNQNHMKIQNVAAIRYEVLLVHDT